MDSTRLVIVIQIGWALLILGSPALCWLCGRAVGVGGGRALLAVAASIALALVAVAQRGDEPLHTNGHAWREAREVLMPVGVRGHGLAPFLHGKGAISLQWLVADVERRMSGTTNPFRISRVAGAAAAGSAALLTIVLVRSVWAGVATGAVLAFMPLARMLAVSGSALTIPAWIMPWSLALLLGAGLSGSRALLAGAVLAGALGTLSHTAMLAWPVGLVLAWLLAARRDVRASGWALAALAAIAAAWLAQLNDCYGMLAQRNEHGLLTEALRGFELRNLFVDPSWVSPVLAPLLLLWVALDLRRGRWPLMLASVLPLALGAVPFFAVTTCSSDAVRYQGALLGLAAGLAVAGLWRIPLAWIGGAGAMVLRVGVLASLAAMPLPAMQQPIDPSVVEHRLVLDAARRMPSNIVVVLPSGRWDRGSILTDFPDFVLPDGSKVLMEDDSRLRQYRGPRLLYLGLACVSWAIDQPEGREEHPTGMRPECRALRGSASPWMVRSLTAADIPRDEAEGPWTFNSLSLDEPFGFFEP
jgi:hypothetical protein